MFKPLIFGDVEQYDFVVYNRWGEVVFKSNIPGRGWDGRLAGTPQDSNMFVWICNYKLKNENSRTEKGTVILIR